MATIITYPTALEYWKKEKGIPYHYHFGSFSNDFKSIDDLNNLFIREKIISSVGPLKFPLPVHVLVPQDIKRNATEVVVFHRLPKDLPKKSFLHIGDDLYICCPELCFLQAAEFKSVPELVLLANELCAIYMEDEQEIYLQKNREMATNTASIRNYLNKIKGIRGIANARCAITYALDRSNSPMESRLAVLTTLSLCRGGYGLEKPELNYQVKLSETGREHLKRNSCCCDMVWPDKKVVLEYDSNLTHLNIEQHFKDKRRSTALTLSGYKVISITAEQVKSFTAIENIFLHLRRVLKMETKKARMDKFLDLRREVVQNLMFKKKNGNYTSWPTDYTEERELALEAHY